MLGSPAAPLGNVYTMKRVPLDRFSHLIEAAAAVAGQVELRSVLRTTVQMALDTTGAKYGALGVIGNHSTLIDFIYEGMDAKTAALIGHPPTGKGVLGLLIEHPEPIRLPRIGDHEASTGFPPNHPPMDSFLGVPVRVGDQVFGNLYLTEKKDGFTEDDLEIVEALAAVAGSAVSAARLHERLTRAALAEDRERIARDLHDSVIQDLFATGLGLQGLAMSIEDERQAHRLDDAVERIDNAIAALRSFIFDIRSFGTTLADPARTIGRMVDRLVGDRPIAVSLDVDQLASCSPVLLDDVLAVVREAASNAIRHAQPSNVSVSASVTNDGVLVTVADDGDGFELSKVKRGMGLDNMAKRAEDRAGALHIDSAPAVGTTVKLELLG